MEHIKKSVGQESFVSRIVGLFPVYVDIFDDKRNEKFKISEPETNCWGQVVPNLEVPGDLDMNLYEIGSEVKRNVVLYNGKTINRIDIGGVHSYQTIMDTYYKYYEKYGIIPTTIHSSQTHHWVNKDFFGVDDEENIVLKENITFPQWVEMGIGRFLTPLNTDISDPYYEWVYLGQIKRYKEEIGALYNEIYENYIFRQERLCKFNNGDFDQFGWQYIILNENTIKKNYKDQTYFYIGEKYNNPNNLPLNIKLTYQSGDILFKNDTNNNISLTVSAKESKITQGSNSVTKNIIIEPNSYKICHIQTIGDYDENNNFNDRFELNDIGCVDLNDYSQDIKIKDSNICCHYDKYLNKGGYFYWQFFNSTNLENFIAKIKTYFKGQSRDDEAIGVSDNTLSIDFNLFIPNSYQDLGILTPLVNEWNPLVKYYKDDIVVFVNEETQIPKCYKCTNEKGCINEPPENSSEWIPLTMEYNKNLNYFRGDVVVEKDENGKKHYYLCIKECINKQPSDFPEFWRECMEDESSDGVDSNEIMTISGKTYSCLQSLRRKKDYVDNFEIVRRPNFPKDWLFYYRLGANNVTVKELPNETVYYGDFLEKIDYDKDKRTITMTYWTDVKLERKEIDDDGNFEYELFENGDVKGNGMFNGIKYKETYIYEEGGELDKLIQGTGLEFGLNFNDYINGVYDNFKVWNENGNGITEEISNYAQSLKLEIDGTLNVRSTLVNDGFKTSMRMYIESTFYKNSLKNGLDSLDYSRVIHHPYDLLLNDRTQLENEVIIDRGNTQAFEKHIRLSEIKTLEDMVNFNNGSFFNINSDDTVVNL